MLLMLCACAPAPASLRPGFDVELTPGTPVAGRELVIRLQATGDDAGLLEGATLDLEAHMTHPGMAPVVVRLREDAPHQYSATMPVTMAGEWVLFVSGRLADGRIVREEVARATAVGE